VEENSEQLSILRHSGSHVLAQAVKELFPEAKLGIGPAIADGFYYDFAVKTPFTEDDLKLIENRMRQIVGKDLPFIKKVVGKEEGLKIFEGLGENLKIELIDEMGDDEVTLYQQGNFVDFCRGPHIEKTGDLKAFKLLSVASAYWRGDEKRESLQRIYGTAFSDQDQLKQFLEAVEEAKKRDHRKLGRELDLFSMHEKAGAGLVYWHPKGMVVRCLI